ncbi:hypothetical protein ACOI1C_17015 [Bacillus sp. DJP31]|uniref:hypothetical protein n=1 Tax=Bacillus sp. DJP31 TaxID=3409789 RepID=UPI003BB772B3
MFDPTIFDNLKVVIEGAVYDQDLEGRLNVIDRSDRIDLAIMSRKFYLFFQLPNQTRSTCRWELTSTLDQLSNEILAKSDLTGQGCSTNVEFTVKVPQEEHLLQMIQTIMDNVWGDRNKEYTLLSPYPLLKDVQFKVKITFDRVIYEEDIDDLLLMFSFMEDTLKLLQQNGY